MPSTFFSPVSNCFSTPHAPQAQRSDGSTSNTNNSTSRHIWTGVRVLRAGVSRLGEQVSGCLRMPFRQRQQELAAVFGVTREQLERWVHEGRISSDQEISEFYPTYESTLERFRRNIADKIIERNQHALRNPHIRLQLNGIDLPSALREITEFLYPFVIVDFQYPDINTPDNNGVTLAYIAAQEGLNDTLRLLVKGLGAEINAPINNGGTPVYIAAQEGRNDTLRVLVKELGAEVNTPTDDDGVTPVCIAAAQGHNDTLRVLVKELGAEVNTPINDGITPVCIAAQEGHKDTLRVLVKELGAEVNTPTDDGVTAVYIAAEDGDNDILRVLVTELGLLAKFLPRLFS